jgi:hypothetical protein
MNGPGLSTPRPARRDAAPGALRLHDAAPPLLVLERRRCIAVRKPVRTGSRRPRAVVALGGRVAARHDPAARDTQVARLDAIARRAGAMAGRVGPTLASIVARA